MTEFSTRSMLEVVVDDRSLSDARDTIESELGSVRATVTSDRSGGGAAGAAAALSDGGSGVRAVLETQTEHLGEIREALEDIRNDGAAGGGGGGGGGLSVSTGLLGALASPTALAAVGAGLLQGGLSVAVAEALGDGDGDAPAPSTPPSEVQTTGVLRLIDAFREFAQSPPPWLSRLTSVSFDTPSWLSDLTTLSFDTPSWLPRLTGFTLDAPPWLADLRTLQLPTPQWVRELQSIVSGIGGGGGGGGGPSTTADNNGRPESSPGSDQRLFNEAARRRDQGRTQVRNDITVEAVINDLGNAQRIIEQSVTQRLRDEVID